MITDRNATTAFQIDDALTKGVPLPFILGDRDEVLLRQTLYRHIPYLALSALSPHNLTCPPLRILLHPPAPARRDVRCPKRRFTNYALPTAAHRHRGRFEWDEARAARPHARLRRLHRAATRKADSPRPPDQPEFARWLSNRFLRDLHGKRIKFRLCRPGPVMT